MPIGRAWDEIDKDLLKFPFSCSSSVTKNIWMCWLNQGKFETKCSGGSVQLSASIFLKPDTINCDHFAHNIFSKRLIISLKRNVQRCIIFMGMVLVLRLFSDIMSKIY